MFLNTLLLLVLLLLLLLTLASSFKDFVISGFKRRLETVNEGMNVVTVNEGMNVVTVNEGMKVVTVNEGMKVVTVNEGMKWLGRILIKKRSSSCVMITLTNALLTLPIPL